MLQVDYPAQDRRLRTIAVDLTPALPGGANGGAKIFALELVRALRLLSPRTEFIVLARAAAFDELAELDAANVRRRLVGGPPLRGEGAGLAKRAKQVLRRPIAWARSLAWTLGMEGLASWHPRRSSRLLRDLHADLLYCPFTAPDLREAGIPVVCTVHDLQYLTFPQFFAAPDLARRERAFRDACRHAAMLAAVSEYTRGTAIATGAIAPERIRVIPQRIARRATGSRAAPDNLLAHLGIEAGRYLLYPANFWPHKNHEALLAAFARAARFGFPPDVRLVCTGAPGHRMEMVRRVAAVSGLEDRTRFPGFLREEEFSGLLQHACAVIFPSLYEGFGMPIIEAMAAGVPVACSDATALPEVAGGAALLFDPCDLEAMACAMSDLVQDARLRARLAAAGSIRAAEFCDTRRMAADYWDLFCAACAARP